MATQQNVDAAATKPQAPKNTGDFSSLLELVQTLRGPQGCPWDKEQTHESLTPYLIEESWELVEAIENGEDQHLIEELGDVLLQVALHAEIARQENRFDIAEVIQSLVKKMVDRHPHVFAQTKADSAESAIDAFLAAKESDRSGPPRIELPPGLPALLAAHKIGQKTKRLRFDWESLQEVLAKLGEELAELDASIVEQNRQAISDEMGDVLFTLAQVSRHLEIDPEAALRGANRRFLQRFHHMLEAADSAGAEFKELPAESKEQLWLAAKQAHPGGGASDS